LAKIFGDLEEKVWRFGENMWRNTFGNLEETCSATWRELIRRFSTKICQRFGEIVRRFWRKPFSDFGENRLALALEIWRNLFGEIMVDDLEKLFGDFGENRSTILYWSSLWSIIMLGACMWRLKGNREKMEANYGDQNFIYHKVKSTYLERFKDRNV